MTTDPHRLPTPWQCPTCPFLTTWKPVIPIHEATHTEAGRALLSERATRRHTKTKNGLTTILPITPATRKQRRGHEHPLWVIRWRPHAETGAAWFQSVIEAPTQAQATTFLKAYAGGLIRITHEEPLQEES